jgi:hypothetical protein
MIGSDDSRLPTPDSLDSEPERYELREAPRYHFDLDRRDFITALGGGLVVCLVARNAGAQQRGGRGRGGGGGKSGPQQIGGWLHIGEDGQITPYCGKTVSARTPHVGDAGGCRGAARFAGSHSHDPGRYGPRA